MIHINVSTTIAAHHQQSPKTTSFTSRFHLNCFLPSSSSSSLLLNPNPLTSSTSPSIFISILTLISSPNPVCQFPIEETLIRTLIVSPNSLLRNRFPIGSLIDCRLIRLLDYQLHQLGELDHQLQNYIMDMRFDNQFSNLTGVGELSRKLVQTKKHRSFSLVYTLVKLALLLPVATANVERVFSAMKIIKTQLRNRVGDEFLNDSLVAYIEKDLFKNVSDEDVIQRFHKMKPRRRLL